MWLPSLASERGGFVIYVPVSVLIADDPGRMLSFACFLTVQRKI